MAVANAHVQHPQRDQAILAQAAQYLQPAAAPVAGKSKAAMAAEVGRLPVSFYAAPALL